MEAFDGDVVAIAVTIIIAGGKLCYVIIMYILYNYYIPKNQLTCLVLSRCCILDIDIGPFFCLAGGCHA